MKRKTPREALDQAISEINFTNISDYRKIKNINPQFGYLDELRAIEGLFHALMVEIKIIKSSYMSTSTSMWELKYERKKKKYKKNEKFNLYLNFIPESGAYEDYY